MINKEITVGSILLCATVPQEKNGGKSFFFGGERKKEWGIEGGEKMRPTEKDEGKRKFGGKRAERRWAKKNYWESGKGRM